MAGLVGLSSEAHGKQEQPAARGEIHFTRKGHIATFGPVVFPGQPLVPREVLPAVGRSHVPDRASKPGRRAGQGQILILATANSIGTSRCSPSQTVLSPPLFRELGGQKHVEVIAAQVRLDRLESS